MAILAFFQGKHEEASSSDLSLRKRSLEFPSTDEPSEHEDSEQGITSKRLRLVIYSEGSLNRQRSLACKQLYKTS